jgi:hypothetical protein
MSFTVHIDRTGWRDGLTATLGRRPGLIPVAKGNGYGLSNERLALEAGALGCDTIAVGNRQEAARVEGIFGGDVLVLNPWDPRTETGLTAADGDLDGPDQDQDHLDPARTIRTISSLIALERSADADTARPARYVIELATPLRRFGIPKASMRLAQKMLSSEPEAFSIHLPMPRRHHSWVDWTVDHVTNALEAGIKAPAVHISHMNQEDCECVAAATGLTVRPRVGTDLWLGAAQDGAGITVTGVVRAIHHVARGDRVGYHHTRVPGRGYMVVVDGGTSHGVGLEAPVFRRGGRRMVRQFGRTVLAALGYVRAPFLVEGKPTRYVEAPHAQVSLIWLQDGRRVPEVGEELEVRVRHTIIHPDRVILD